jgi:hypothetical protein
MVLRYVTILVVELELNDAAFVDRICSGRLKREASPNGRIAGP